jgi:Flp pilus assembly pilin Flp
MAALLARFVRGDDGQDLIEYGLLLGIITVASLLALTTIGATVVGYFTGLAAALP